MRPRGRVRTSGKPWQLDLGAQVLDEGRVRFRVWAPHATRLAVRVTGEGERTMPLEAQANGYFEAIVPGVSAGMRYRFVLDAVKERPDPASRGQPEGIHGPSAVVDPRSFRWTDQAWRGLPLKDLIVYELHTGTFTQMGTFDAVIPHLSYLKQTVGITAIELMPVAQFPGDRNWGYDGVYPFAPQSTYGGPEGLRRLVDACHAAGLAVILDVVYNHLGPEGNYLGEYGPYFTDRYRTPWGAAINYDGPGSDEVRHYVVSNALHWITEYHIDGLRLDAIHGIFDFSAVHVLRALADAVHAEGARLGRTVLVIAESDLNDTRVLAPSRSGGHGLDGQWNDDFHHALRVTLTGEHAGYYRDFAGLQSLATAIRRGFVYTGQYSKSRGRSHGVPSRGIPAGRFVVFAQNHDQVGNRALGDRLSVQVPFEALKAAAAPVLLGPNIPLLFMGEEYGETAPFQYFIDHGDEGLIEAVREGRRREFVHWGGRQDIPDPQDPATFLRCKLNRESHDENQTALLRWVTALIALRKSVAALAACDTAKPCHRVWTHEPERILILHRWAEDGSGALLVAGFNPEPVTMTLPRPPGTWIKCADSTDPAYGGSGRAAFPATLPGEGGVGGPITVPPYGTVLYSSTGPVV